jgi:TPR repeat protein
MNDIDSQLMAQAMHEYMQKNYVQALKLLTDLSENGNHKAKCYLASLYQCGLGVDVNTEKAIYLYLQVAEKHISIECLSGVAYHNIATIYRVGAPGVYPDYDKADKYSRLARINGFIM